MIRANMFSEKDLAQIKQGGSDESVVATQINNFKNGFPFLRLIEAASIGKGILRLDEAACRAEVARFEAAAPGLKILKFVPASGAASRMFKSLFDFREKCSGSPADRKLLESDQGPNAAFSFFKELEKFPFYEELAAVAGGKSDLEKLRSEDNFAEILDLLLTDKGLNYGNLPKGLLAFHLHKTGNRKAVEEHLVEGADHARGAGKIVRLHFTVSANHRQNFIELLDEKVPVYEKDFGVKYDISFSEQKAETDTIAVTLENEPFREEDGSILFRPAGHGALIENLNELDADLVFIKNIDNVAPDRLKADTFLWKKAAAGLLLGLREEIFALAENLEKNPGAAEIAAAETFFTDRLFTVFPETYRQMSSAEKAAYLAAKSDRPIRICGMVKNEGEPGGGPFFAQNPDGSSSLQIAETAQIDFGKPDQAVLAKNSTHFNPTDLVCSLRDRHGKKYDLRTYVDPTSGFISLKSKNGRELKAQELPGLWNGAMSDWNTLFVEVPTTTFSPVKTVNDLLRDAHRA